MLEQFITKIRPNLDYPFFEDTDEGRDRSNAIIELAKSRPDLLIKYEGMPRPASDLIWTSTWTFVGDEEFRAFLQIQYEYDPNLRLDRATYYMEKGHTLRIEFKGITMEERELQVEVTPGGATRRLHGLYYYKDKKTILEQEFNSSWPDLYDSKWQLKD